MAGQQLVNVGFGNYVLASRVVAIVNPLSSPMRRLRDDVGLNVPGISAALEKLLCAASPRS